MKEKQKQQNMIHLGTHGCVTAYIKTVYHIKLQKAIYFVLT